MAEIKKILVPTDFSENAAAVYPIVKETAEKYDAQVDLIHIIPTMSYFDIARDSLGFAFDDKDKYSELREELKQRLDAELEKHFNKEYAGRTYVMNADHPSKVMADHAKKGEYDLIMIATRGLGKSIFKRGSVTERLIRVSNVPVFSVNRGYERDIKTIVVPTDGSLISLEALPMALTIAAKNKAKIQLVGVSEVSVTKMKVAGRNSYIFTDREVREHAFNGLKKCVAAKSTEIGFVGDEPNPEEEFKLKDASGNEVGVSIVVEKGMSAHSTIVNYAENNAQLVIMGTHGRSEMANLFIGSSTEKVFRHLELPLLTIKPEFVKK